MEIIKCLSVFFSIKILFYILGFSALFILWKSISKKVKNKIAVKFINNVKEKYFLQMVLLLFFISTGIAINLSTKILISMNIALTHQIVLIITTLEIIRFSYAIYKEKYAISFAETKEWLYKYTKK